ncbi:MAG TPA: putative sugar nucleotidyl transferase [Gemmatimonadales bacterium]|nr:putative sugar nucleotidyl transferase [Gemmatimonadales bacterium]
MSVQLFLYDAPEDLPLFLPFSLTRPLGELRYGAFLLRERWSARLSLPVTGYLTPHQHLREFVEPGAPVVVAGPGEKNEPRLLLRSTFVPAADLGRNASPAEPVRFVDGGGATVGYALPRRADWPGFDAAAAWHQVPLAGKRLGGVWELVGDLNTVLRADLEHVRPEQGAATIPRGAVVLGDPALAFVGEATLEPQVVLDVRNGPIMLAPGVEVRAFARLVGPLAVARDTRILGGQVSGSAVGPKCVVNGEVSATLFLGYANKAHDGFLGHSVVGRWVNLGAGTTNSNLKNTYGPVRVSLGGARHETGLMFMGSLIGDHVKTAIGTMLPTGCVIGVGANLFGTARPPSEVPPFAWGLDEPGALLECGRFVEIAARVMPRRDVAVDQGTRRYLAAVWGAATGRAPCG